MKTPQVIYQYKNENGELLYEKLRYPEKRFVQRQPDENGGWINNLEGIEQVPYRLPELVAALRADQRTFVVLTEGEKDCDNVRKLGFLAVSSFKDWKPRFNRYIKGRLVFLLADKDTAGERLAYEAASVIAKDAESVRIVDLFPHASVETAKGLDVTDWIFETTKYGASSQHGVAGDLRDAMMAAPEFKSSPPYQGGVASPPIYGGEDGVVLSAQSAKPLDPPDSKNSPDPIADDYRPFFIRKTATEWNIETKRDPRAKRLFDEFWCEGELCILFADTNTGKSILSVQIGESIASGEKIADFKLETAPQKVLYFDFELSRRQFLARYSIEEGDYYTDDYIFHHNFERVEMDTGSDIPAAIDFEAFLFARLKDEILDSEARVVIIDNITFLRQDNEKARHAAELMRQLKRLKEQQDLSMLVMAHTPKRSSFNPLSINDLSGSKMLANFCDSCFAIGTSNNDRRLRYLKQIKMRNSDEVFHSGNVALARIVKPDNFLRFEFEGFGNEREHLKSNASDEMSQEELIKQAKELREENKSYREIGETLGISLKRAERLVKESH